VTYVYSKPFGRGFNNVRRADAPPPMAHQIDGVMDAFSGVRSAGNVGALGLISNQGPAADPWQKSSSDRGFPQPVDFFRYIDTRLRRIEAGAENNSRFPLTGVRLHLKRVLDNLGQRTTVYPFVANDGEGGVFAEWRAPGHRIEVSVEDGGNCYVLLAGFNFAEPLDMELTDPIPFEQKEVLRRLVEAHSAAVKLLNPNWVRFFLNQ